MFRRSRLQVICAIVALACSGGGGGGNGGPTPPPPNQPPTLSISITIEVDRETDVTIRVVGNATDSDGMVTRVECQGDFSGTFAASFSETRIVSKAEGASRNYGTSCMATDDDGATATASDAVQIPPGPIVFTGAGTTATAAFSLGGGFTVFASEHAGESNFIVWLLDNEGNNVELIANEIGVYSGTRGFGVSQGQYLLDIDADGSWQIKIQQPRPTSGASPPQTETGAGDNVIGPLQLSSGLARFDSQHAGESNFIVWLFRADGERVALLVNEIGDASETTAENIPTSGIYFLDVQADGEWQIAIEQ